MSGEDEQQDEAHAEAVRRFWSIPEQVDDPQWAARRRLAAAVRALTEGTIQSEGSTEQLLAAAEAVEAVAQGLPGGRRAQQAFAQGDYFDRVLEFTDRSMLMGWSNPVAPPMHPVFHEEHSDGQGVSECTVVLGERFVGAPGMVHGGMVAACFDQICGHRVAMAGRGGFTTRLDVRYLRPVPVHTEVTFRCVLTRQRPFVFELAGTCHREERLLAECTATFRLTRPEQARSVIARAGR